VGAEPGSAERGMKLVRHGFSRNWGLIRAGENFTCQTKGRLPKSNVNCDNTVPIVRLFCRIQAFSHSRRFFSRGPV
jgi:hypothetical protein